MKERSDSLVLKGLIAAQSRLSSHHSMLPVLAAKQSSIEAGIGGEERVAELFRRYTFSFKNNIFHDLSLSSDSTFQIDHTFLTPSFGILFETKNIAGSLEFKDDPPQLIQTKENGERKAYESPVVQLERNLELLASWLQARNITLPLFGAIVLAYPKQIVTVPPANTKLLFPNMIPPFINSLPQNSKKLDSETFHWLCHELLRCHRPYIPKPISESYHIPVGDFQPGVRCLDCGKIGMIKLPRTWHCPYCGVNNNKAHVPTMLEWFLACNRTITNRECREWLHVDIHTATRILQGMDLKKIGTFRNRVYVMDFRQFK
nr:nuclease-related domain-containing protein [Neobacillus sp. Marseille-Q6967]